MSTLTAALSLKASAKLVGTNELASQLFSPAISVAMNLANGTLADQANLMYAAQRAIADGANDDLDLSGTLVNAIGETLTMAELVAILVYNKPVSGVNTTDLTIGNEGTNPFEGFLSAAGTIGPIKPGGFVFLGASDVAGLGTVTAGTGDKLRIANSAGAANNYQIMLLGRSA